MSDQVPRFGIAAQWMFLCQIAQETLLALGSALLVFRLPADLVVEVAREFPVTLVKKRLPDLLSEFQEGSLQIERQGGTNALLAAVDDFDPRAHNPSL